MRNLKTFQEKIEAYRKNAPTPHTQKELAEAIPLDKDELSKRLNAYKHPGKSISPLTCAQVQAIVRVLTRWGAIETQEQATDLLDLMECPHFSVSDWKTHPLNLLRSAPSPTLISGRLTRSSTQRREEGLARLHAMQVDHSGFLHARWESFVGRQYELAEISHHISTMLPIGGYITITGQAGQGKSSIIARLVEEYGPEKTAHHFIPFNPGSDYQVSLLHDLMARLILKHDLPDWYVASDSRPALRDHFCRVLIEIAAKGKQEVIFIDGLDQLIEDQYGERDLSFLPNNPPVGVVIVLGTRPDDILSSLELNKSRHKYELPNVSKKDFDLILEHRGVKLNFWLADQLYQMMQGNALYLDLVAKELAQQEIVKPEEIIERVSDNPGNVFSLSIARLKRHAHAAEWREVLKPILGMLLVAREPLHIRTIRHILQIDSDRLKDGLVLLGGLITDDGQQRYSLFHRKLYDYLRQDPKKPEKEYIFATDEEEAWHQRLADWCAIGDLITIWEDAEDNTAEQYRREYARRYYITHLFSARERRRLFDVLNEGKYGRAKIRWAKMHYDPRAHSYAQDLNLGRQAAAWKRGKLKDGIALLPLLWQYTLLHCSLASQVGNYNLEAFEALLLLHREQEALSLVDLKSAPESKAYILLQIVEYMKQQTRENHEYLPLLVQAYETALLIEENETKAHWLIKVGEALAQAEQWGRAEAVWREAEEVALSINDKVSMGIVLTRLAEALGQLKQWRRAEAVWREAEEAALSIEDKAAKGIVLARLAEALGQLEQWGRAEELCIKAWRVMGAIEDISMQMEILHSFVEVLVPIRITLRPEKRSIRKQNEAMPDRSFWGMATIPAKMGLGTLRLI